MRIVRKVVSATLVLIFVMVLAVGCVIEESSIPKYIVSFDSNGGTPIEPQQVVLGEQAIQPANPTQGLKQFLSWYEDADFNNEWNFDTRVVTQDITLYSKWFNPMAFTKRSLNDIADGDVTDIFIGGDVRVSGNNYIYRLSDDSILPNGISLTSDGHISGTAESGIWKGVIKVVATDTKSSIEDIWEFEINVTTDTVAVEQPTYDGAPLYYGDPLPTITTTTVGGTVALDPGQELSVGTNDYTWTFTGTDSNTDFTNTTGTISLVVEQVSVGDQGPGVRPPSSVAALVPAAG